MVVTLFAIGCTTPAVSSEVEQAAPLAADLDPLRAHWTIDADFSADDVDAITQAAADWHTASGGRVDVTFAIAPAAGEPWTITRATEAEAPDVYARTLAGLDRILIVTEKIPPGCMWLTAAHELGHTFGIGHSDSGIMSGKHSATMCEDRTTITPTDLALLPTE